MGKLEIFGDVVSFPLLAHLHSSGAKHSYMTAKQIPNLNSVKVNEANLAPAPQPQTSMISFKDPN